MTDSEDLKQRYSRQIAIEEIGKTGQEKLLTSKVLVVGCGALGSMAAMQLAGAGVGVIGIADFDNIDISNLQRQFFFDSSDAGKSKVEVLKNRLLALNPSIEVKAFSSLINTRKAEEIFADYDFIIDATDNPDSKKITGEVARQKQKPCCIGGVSGFRGQVMTFLPDDMRFEDYFGEASNAGFLPCSIGGVIGPAAALCASIQVSETLKFITGVGELLSGGMIVFDLKNNSFHKFSY